MNEDLSKAIRDTINALQRMETSCLRLFEPERPGVPILEAHQIKVEHHKATDSITLYQDVMPGRMIPKLLLILDEDAAHELTTQLKACLADLELRRALKL